MEWPICGGRREEMEAAKAAIADWERAVWDARAHGRGIPVGTVQTLRHTHPSRFALLRCLEGLEAREREKRTRL